MPTVIKSDRSTETLLRFTITYLLPLLTGDIKSFRDILIVVFVRATLVMGGGIYGGRAVATALEFRPNTAGIATN